MKYDVIIIGGGPAGLAAGIFTSRAGLNNLMIEKLVVGGQAALSYDIANYPGFESISGFELTEKMKEHATSFGLKIEYGEVIKLTKGKDGFRIDTLNDSFYAEKVIIASGTKTRKLGLDKENEFIGKGISYCASCDGNFFKDKIVAIQGGGNSAIEYVEYLSRLASKIYLIHRRDCFRANDVDVERVKNYKNVQLILNTSVTKLYGKDKLEEIEISTTDKNKKLKIDGLFVAIGFDPDIKYVKLKLDLDDNGYILVDKNMQTNVKDLYAAGDIVSKHFRQVVSACADGALAGHSVINNR